MELKRDELAAIKRVNQNSRPIYKQIMRNREAMVRLTEKHNKLIEDLNDNECFVLKKFGFYSEQILSGEADRILEQRAREIPDATEATQFAEPAEETTETVDTTVDSEDIF